jgi:hypothetical protein
MCDELEKDIEKGSDSAASDEEEGECAAPWSPCNKYSQIMQ